MTTLEFEAGPHAFGDGSHPTTAGMLAALRAIDPAAFTPRHAIDIGAGSGILSFSIIEHFGCPVIATDIEASAIATIHENATRNGVAGRITALQADGFHHPTIAASAPYDLITINILAEPLLSLAHDAERHLASDGVLILSGILVWQEAQIQAAYAALGLELTSRLVIGDWVTLLWQKP